MPDESPCDEWTEEAMLLHRLRPFVPWHSYEGNFGAHPPREKDRHQAAAELLEDIAYYLEDRL